MAQKIIQPQKGFQEKFITSNVDVVFGGGSAGSGKSASMVIASAYHIDNPLYRALYVRKALGELSAGGGLLDEFRNIYPKEVIAGITTSESPEIEFKSGARAVLTHMSDENPKKLHERVKGWQYDAIFLDELTGYSFSTFTYLLSRNRGSSGIKPIMRATTNPKRSCWVRRFIDWYIDADGHIDPEKDGVIRYFYNAGNTVDDVVWGDSKEEVYNLCKSAIDKFISASKRANNKLELTYEHFIKSFTFYGGSIFDNAIQLERDPNYVGSLAATGAASADQLLGGNWNVDEEEEIETPVPINKAKQIFENDANATGKKYITADIAGEGEDNMVIAVWNGFHLIDVMILNKSKPQENIRAIMLMQEKHEVGNSNVVYDAVAIGNYIGDFIQGAIPFKGNLSPTASGKQRYINLKTQCADRLIELINNRAISCSKEVASRPYKHQNIKEPITVAEEIINEFQVLKFDKMSSTGKMQLIQKREMCRMLGKGRSPDFLDNFIMLMYPYLSYSSMLTVDRNFIQEVNVRKNNEDYIDIFDFLN